MKEKINSNNKKRFVIEAKEAKKNHSKHKHAHTGVC
jgi:hypothetical protein